MFKNNVFLLTLLVSLFAYSCGNNGNEAATAEAEEVKVVETTETAIYATVKEGVVNWRASHLGGVQKRHGNVMLQVAKVLVNDGKVSNATVIIDLSTLTVENFPADAPEKGKLTGHLKSADFFNIEKYPTAKFELTNIESTTGEYNSKVTGNLTILEATKSITFNANVTMADNEVSIKSEDFSVDRTEWGLSYNIEGTAGVPVDYLIANDIGFTIDVTMTK